MRKQLSKKYILAFNQDMELEIIKTITVYMVSSPYIKYKRFQKITNNNFIIN